MSGTIGRGMAITVNDGGGVVAVNNLTSCDLSLDTAMAETTTMDDDEWRTSIIANKQVTCDCTANYAESGGLDDVLDEAFTSFGTVAVVVTPLSGGNTYSFTANVTSVSISMPMADKIELSFSLESTGAVTLS